MRHGKIIYLLGSMLLVFFASIVAEAQQAPEMIVFNGKILTVDDNDFTPQIGTIAQAMAVQGGKIVAVGSDLQVQAQAGSNTRMIDLKGRTVLPGLISVHEHPYDWAGVNPHTLKKVLTDDIVVVRILEGSPEDQLKAFPGVLQEAVSKANAGQWIYIIFSLGDQYQYATRGNGWYGLHNMEVLDGKQVTKALLDQTAPSNPVLLRDAFVGMMVNEKALEEIDKVFHQADTNLIDRETGQGGRDGGANFRSVFHEVVMQGHYRELKEMHRLELSWWSGYGMTAFGSLAYTPSNIRVYKDLSESGQMSVRSMWMWNWREDVLFADQYVINSSVFMENLGDDFFWYGGAQGSIENGRECTILEPLIELTPRQRACAFAPGREPAEMLYRYIQSGGRFVGNHTVGDKDIDNILDIITKASEDAGFTLEQVRAKRHTYDHLVMSPRPDQIPRIKNLGMILGGAAFEIYQASPDILEAYGERALEWVVPKKSLIDAEIPSGFEIDRALSGTDLTMFWTLARMIDRKAWDGKVYGESQQISRELSLKVATTWGSQYMKKENVLGSLEPGKWADFIVLDRDYLTVPEEQIQDIKVLMTVSGGRVVHLVSPLAEEIGMQPRGAQVELGSATTQGKAEAETRVALSEAYTAPGAEVAIPIYLWSGDQVQVGSMEFDVFF